MVWISGFGELVSDSQSDGMHYAFDPSSGGKIFLPSLQFSLMEHGNYLFVLFYDPNDGGIV